MDQREVLGQIGNETYYRTPKADGGYDYFKTDGTHNMSISGYDAFVEFKDANVPTQVAGYTWRPDDYVNQWAERGYTSNPLTGTPVANYEEVNTDYQSANPTGTTGGATQPAFQPTPYDDGTGSKLYYTAEDLAAAVDRRINKDYSDSVRQIENNFKNGFISIDERDAEIKRTRSSLVEKRKTDLQSVSGYFNAISPDAVQSGRNTMEGKAVDEYTKQNTALGSELGGNLYGADGRIRQDLTSADVNPYMNELSDTGNLARAIASNYENRAKNMDSARSTFNAGKTQNAGDYVSNLPSTANVSDYSKYINSTILGGYKPLNTGVSFSSVQKTDKYGNPIDDYIYKGM